MWTDKDFYNLKTFAEYVEENTLSGVFSGTEMDEATQEDILDWFYFRKICDNERFGRYFKRQVNLLQNQYNQYLRIESTVFDPMVSQYIERQIKGSNTASSTTESSASTTANGTSERSDNSTVTGSSTNTGTDGTTTTVTHDTKESTNGSTSSTDNGTTNTTHTITSKDEHSGTDTTTQNSTSSGSESRTGTDKTERNLSGRNETISESDARAYAGNTPQNAINSTSTAFPDAFDWTYLSSQTEQKNDSDTTNVQTSTGIDTVTYNTTTSTEGKGDVLTDLEHGEVIDHTGSENTEVTNASTGSGTSSSDTTHTGTETTEVSGTNGSTQESTTTNAGTSTTTENKTSESTGTSTQTQTGDNVQRERMTGRGEAPQDMLDRARLYILRTNAFEWLVRELDKCFLSVYN